MSLLRNELVLVLEVNPLSIGLRMVNIPSCMQELTSHNKIVYNYQKEKSVLPEISFHTYTIRTIILPINTS